MHAFIIVGQNDNNYQSEVDTIKVKQKLVRLIPVTLQKVEDARELKKLVKFSFSEKTGIVINNIDNATNETVNAFLKNLEEPSKNITYILTATNIENVLPTIVSRCEVIKVDNTNAIEFDNDIKSFNDSTIDEKLNFISKIKDRNEAILFVENIIYFDHLNQIFSNMENSLSTLKNLKANGNVSLQLTNFVVTMNR